MKKPIQLLISGIILFVGGIIAYVLVVLFSFILALLPLWTGDPDIQFLIPGTVEVKVEEEGKYYLWHDYQTVYQGKTYSKPEEVPDNLTISLKTKDGSLHFNIIGKTSITMSFNSTSKKSIGYFNITHPGDYILEVQGESEPRVFSFGQLDFDFALIFLTMFIVGPVCFLISLVGFVLAVIGTVKMVKAKRR